MEYVLRTVMFALVICGVVSADQVKVKSVMEGDSVTLNPDLTQIQRINHIKWLFQKKGSNTAENIRNVEILKNKSETNDQTRSLTINNIRTKHSGLYTLEINHDNGINNASFNVTVNEVPSVIEAHKAEIKILTVKKGDSVDLVTNITEFHGDELIVWRFGDEGKLLAKEDKETKSPPYYNADERYKDRLKLNDQTGSLTIKNTKDTDAGYYTVRISSNKQTTYKKFTVNFTGSCAEAIIALLVVFAVVAGLGFLYHRHKISELQEHVVETKCVQQGGSVTLEPDTEIELHDEIQWTFGDQDVLIAKMGKMTGETREITYPNKGFRDILELDKETGSLFIKNVTIEHRRGFKVKISSWKRRTTKTTTFCIMINAVTNDKETKYVQQGELLILMPDAKIKRDDEMQWMFGDQDALIAKMTGMTREISYPDERFRDRLELDKKTGSLTIKNITIEHTGDFKVKISSSRTIVETKIFSIKIKAKKVRVLEGRTAVLKSAAEIQTDDEIEWTFEHNKSPIAELKDGRKIFPSDGCNRIFRDTLDLDKKFGSLTIKNMRPELAGEYNLKIKSSRSGDRVRKFTVAVTDETMTVMDGRTAVLQSHTEIQPDDQIEWRFNESPIAEVKDGQISISDGPDEIFKDALGMDKKTGSLTIKNFRDQHAGDYYLKINNSRSGDRIRRFTVYYIEETVRVVEGDTAVLKMAAEIQRDDHIEWKFNTNESPIAEIKDGQIFTSDGHDEMFKDRLDLDKKTGSLTIKNIRRGHAGAYRLIIKNKRSAFFHPFFSGDRRLLNEETGFLTIESIRREDAEFYQLNTMNSSSATHAKAFNICVNEERVTFIKGKTAVLMTSAEIQRDDQIEWRFNTEESPIAEIKDGQIFTYAGPDEIFKDRLELDKVTGFLTIRIIRHEHAGIYQLKIMNNSSAAYVKTFTVIVIAENETGPIFQFPGPEWFFKNQLKLDEETRFSTIENIRREHAGIYQLKTMNSSSAARVKTFNICVNEEKETFVEGDTAVLKSAAEIQRDDQIEWRFNTDEFPIAEIKDRQIFLYAGPDGMFKDRLELDEKTGFLTIKNIRREHAGVYQLKIMNSSSAVRVKTLTVFVNEEKVRVMAGRTAVLESAAEIQKEDHVEWRFEYKRSPIAEIKDEEIFTYDGPGGRFRDTVDLDKKTGSLTIRNVGPEHAGFYLLKIKKNNSAVHEKRFTVPFVVSKRKQVKNSAIEETPLSHEETPLLHEDVVIYENERMSSL